MDHEYELERIDGHLVDDFGVVRYKVIWKYWPPTAATLVPADELKESASELLKEYHRSLGITEFYSEDEVLLKLTATALSEPPKLQKKVWVVKILSHRSINGEFVFAAEFNTKEVVYDRPRYAFVMNFEKDLLQDYIEANLPSSSKHIAPAKSSPPEGRKRPTRSRNDFALRRSPSVDLCNNLNVPGPSGDRSRSSSPEILSDSDASFTLKKVLGKRVTRSTSFKKSTTKSRRGGSASTTPKTRGEVTGTKRSFTSTGGNVVVKKGRNTCPPRCDIKSVMSIYKDEHGVAQVLTKNIDGAHSVEELDAAYSENPKFIYESMKRILLEKHA